MSLERSYPQYLHFPTQNQEEGWLEEWKKDHFPDLIFHSFFFFHVSVSGHVLPDAQDTVVSTCTSKPETVEKGSDGRTIFYESM